MNITPCIQVRSTSIVVYNKYERSFRLRTDAQLKADENLTEQETYTGRLCPGAKKRLIKAIELITQAAFKTKEFLYTSKKTLKEVRGTFKLNFITLTIHNPGKMIEGQEGHALCLEPLLKWLRDHYGLKMYIWKAELQSNREDVKQLHYHITSDCFVPWYDLWLKWGQLNEAAGYLNDWFSRQPRVKIDQNGNEVINYPVAGTDVHSVYKIRDMAKYMRKCVCKNVRRKDGSIISEFKKEIQNAASVGGKVWDCSLNLKREKYFTIECKDLYNNSFGRNERYMWIMNTIDTEAKNEGNKKVVTDNCTIYEFQKPAINVIPDFFVDEYLRAMERILNYKRVVNFEPDPDYFSSS